MARLRWKKQPRETGLSSIGAGPRGSVYWDGENKYANVYAFGGSWRGPLEGWYFTANGHGIPLKNTCDDLCETEAEAKKQAAEYVKKHMT